MFYEWDTLIRWISFWLSFFEFASFNFNLTLLPVASDFRAFHRGLGGLSSEAYPDVLDAREGESTRFAHTLGFCLCCRDDYFGGSMVCAGTVAYFVADSHRRHGMRMEMGMFDMG